MTAMDATYSNEMGMVLTEAARAFYDGLAHADAERRLVTELVIPKVSGDAFEVPKGHIVRITCIDGGQVCDFNAFFRDDPTERFWSGRTRLLQSAHLTVGDRLWSTPPRMRPMFTIIADTVEHAPLPHNARCHDLMYCRCNERHVEIKSGLKGQPNCNDNMAGGIAKFGLGADLVHDAFNIFMTTGLGDDDRFFYVDAVARKGDYMELYAEIDCIVALSACPGGSSGPDKHPLGVQVFEPVEG